jgi:hypothetical protein
LDACGGVVGAVLLLQDNANLDAQQKQQILLPSAEMGRKSTYCKQQLVVIPFLKQY